MTEQVFKSVGSKEGLVERVVQEIESLIINGQLAPNTKLPAERELAEQLGVSRPVLREAVRILVTKGLLETQHGVGTIVRQLSSEQVIAPLSMLMRVRSGGQIPFEHLHQVRTMLETEIAALAAERATAAEIDYLHKMLTNMQTHQHNAGLLARYDNNFHRAISKMAHNPLLDILLESIRELLHDYIAAVTPYLNPATDVLPLHPPIMAAIANKEPQQARLAMQRHQEQMRKNHLKFIASLTHDNPE